MTKKNLYLDKGLGSRGFDNASKMRLKQKNKKWNWCDNVSVKPPSRNGEL